MRRILFAAAALAVASVAAPALAQDAPASPITVTGNVTAVTDYRFRGVTQTNKHPAIQGGATIAHSSGFYVGGWGSSIDQGTAAGANAELDLIAGYSKTFDGLTVDGGLLYYYYPGATKGANISQAVSLAKELGGTGVTANTVSPGPTRTPGMEAGARAMAEAQGQPYDFNAFEQFYVQQTKLPAGKIGSPGDIANMVAFVSSPLADYITGANIRVDGGMTPTIN